MSLLGIKSKLFRNTGSWDVPTWVEIAGISDFARSGSWNKANRTTRKSRIELSRKTTMQLSYAGKVEADPDDAGYVALYDAFLSEDPIDLMILNGDHDENGRRGFRGYWSVTQGNEDQGTQNVIFEDFVLDADELDDHYPQSVLVESGVPVFTSLAPGA